MMMNQPRKTQQPPAWMVVLFVVGVLAFVFTYTLPMYSSAVSNSASSSASSGVDSDELNACHDQLAHEQKLRLDAERQLSSLFQKRAFEKLFFFFFFFFFFLTHKNTF
jgi:Na+/melibiose symporter-like transporter